MKYYSGIDVGGSKILAIIIDEKATILGKAKLKTWAGDKKKSLKDKIIECYMAALKDSTLDNSQIEALGVAVPSAVNVENGVLIHAPNLQLKDVKLSKSLRKVLQKPVLLDNDVNLGVLGEYYLGAGKRFHNIYGIFLGTGIGGGYIRNGDIIRGSNYTAGEIGHMIIKLNGPKCGCGNNGCLESIAGKVGIINYIEKLEEKLNKKSLINELYPNWKNGVGSSVLKKCYKKKDKIVTKAINKAAEAIGVACANLINIVGIDAIIFGGGLYHRLAAEMNPIIKQNMDKYSISGGSKGVYLLESKLQDNSVALGAAWIVSLPQYKLFLKKN